MSNELIQAADDARRLLRGFAAIETVAASFEKVGMLEQRKTEVEASLLDLESKVLLASSSLTSTLEQVETANAEAKRMTADAKTVADGIVSSANMKADGIISDANAAAAETRAAAESLRAQADAHVTNLEAHRDTILAETTALEERATAAREYLAKLQG